MFDRKDKSYDKDSLQTPQYLFNFAEFLLPRGEKFEVDLAASHNHHLCKSYMTKEDDALTLAWYGNKSYGFCNPPYSKLKGMKVGFVDLFVKKAIREARKGFTTIMVIPELNGEARSLDIMNNARRIVHFDQRVGFIHPLTGKEQKGNNRGTIVVEFSRKIYNRVHYCLNIEETKEIYK